MTTQQTRNVLFPQVRRLTDRQLGHALTIVEERASVLLLGESGLGPEARTAFIEEVREELERRRIGYEQRTSTSVGPVHRSRSADPRG